MVRSNAKGISKRHKVGKPARQAKSIVDDFLNGPISAYLERDGTITWQHVPRDLELDERGWPLNPKWYEQYCIPGLPDWLQPIIDETVPITYPAPHIRRKSDGRLRRTAQRRRRRSRR